MVRKLVCILSLLLLFMLVFSACAPKATPAATEPPATEPPATEPPATEPPLEPTETPELEPVVLTGPPMEVGSKFTYVDGSILVAVPAGPFIMGHGGEDNPEHTVSLSDFWIYRTEVTNAQYARCVEADDCVPPDLGLNSAYSDPLRVNDPMVGVDYDQAVSYCAFVHGRLPTEAEWEKTARGPDGNTYSWGEASPSCKLTNLAECVGKTTDVTAYPDGRSYYDALDTSGNVFEWVADWYQATYYGEAPAENPLGPETGTKRSVRSSAFASPFYFAELARRYSNTPTEARADLGFRCVVEDPTTFAPYCEYLTVYGMNNGIDPLSSPGISVTCPSLNISQNQYCGDNYTPLTNVQFSYNPSNTPVTINVPPAPTCIPAGGDLYTCNAAVGVSICADCELTVTVDPDCPPGYHKSGTTCLPDNLFPGECLPGVNYDPVNQCCSTQALTSGVGPLCLAGTYYYNPPGGCFALPGAPNTCMDATVALKSCEPTGGGCQPPAGGCPIGSSWDPSKCCCDRGGTCL